MCKIAISSTKAEERFLCGIYGGYYAFTKKPRATAHGYYDVTSVDLELLEQSIDFRFSGRCVFQETDGQPAHWQIVERTFHSDF